MGKCIILLEDEPDLAHLVRELLDELDFKVVHVASTDEMLLEAARLSPCVALLDSTDPKGFDLWPMGPRLAELGVPAVAFTAHASARREFETNARGFVGVVSKPFDADEFIEVVENVCWAGTKVAAS